MVKTTLKRLNQGQRLIRRVRQPAGALVIAAVMGGALIVSGTIVQAQTTKPSVKTAAVQKAEASRTQALGLRVEELEEQIVDLQVVIGTLESLAKTGGQPSGATFTNGRAASVPGKGDARLKTQFETLSQQVAKLSEEVSALQQARGGRPIAAPPPLGPPAPAESVQGTSIGSGFGATTVSPAQAPRQAGAQTEPVDAIAGLIREPIAPIDGSAGPSSQTAVAAQPSAPTQGPASGSGTDPGPVSNPNPAPTGEAKATYDQAYGDLLQQDFANAQAGFRKFLRQFPQHTLVPNALYWLGETYYVQQNYTDAAEAFDIVTAAYARSNKAPDSQLKRGMSLANLGKRSEACTVLQSLAKRYPNAPAYVKSKADSERQRVGCT